MEKFHVSGMSCSACQAHVEKAVLNVPGVSNVSVSLLTNSMQIEGTANRKDIIKAVKKAGYSAKVISEKTEVSNSENTNTEGILLRLILSVFFLLILMYFSMGHNMFSFPIPYFLDNILSLGILQMLITIVVLIINKHYFINGFKGILHGGANMDTLVALGTSAAFLYSVSAIFYISYLIYSDKTEYAMQVYMKHIWFESSAMIPTLITIGKTLESFSKGKTTDALKGLIDLIPKKANVIKNGEERLIDIKEIAVGDIFIVKPGEKISCDGVIIEGKSTVDESALTGESIPVDKIIGDKVSAATINKNGYLKCRVSKIGEDTFLSKIIQMVSDAAATKAPIARIADKAAAIFVPTIIIISLITCLGWFLAGKSFSYSLTRAISVLVISCPCALGLATPVAIMVSSGMGAKNGVLFKNATALENCGNIKVLAFDKTGTITNGTPAVTDIIENDSRDELLTTAVSLESKSEHPLSYAICNYGIKNNITTKEITDFEVLSGKGIRGRINGVSVFAGDFKFVSQYINISEDFIKVSDDLSIQGKTPLFFANGNIFLGIIAVADTIKQDSIIAIKKINNMGIKTVMITGDNKNTAKAIANQVGINNIIAEVLPDEKANVIKKLKKSGKTAMVGDGINDAPALTTADVGIAIGNGTDIAIDAADIVLVNSKLYDVYKAIKLSKNTIKNIKQNLFWAFFYNIICIPLAIGIYQLIFNWNFTLSPAIGALAMSLSSVTVCLNALRLNSVKLNNKK